MFPGSIKIAFLLQQQSLWLKESDPRAAIGVLIALGILVVVLSGMNIAKNGLHFSTGGGGGGGAKAPRRFSKGLLRRVGASYGLNGDQIAVLEDIFRKNGVMDVESTLANSSNLDRYLKKAYREIEKTAETEEAAEENKYFLFSIRNTIESAHSNNATISSTRKLADNMAATITTPKNETYPVKIISAKGDNLVVEAPRSAVGTPLRFPRGSKITLSFYSKSSQGYRFETRVQGILDTPRGPALQLAHSDKVASLPNRRYKRKETHLSCFFSLVRIEERSVGRKIEKHTIVDDRRSLGTIMDISAGGCSIKSAAALSAGLYLKIEFDDAHDRTLAVLGRVVRTNKTGAMGGIMHVQFVKIPRRTLNGINALVFEYDQD
jgi:c-di-GMP-binding flagellar brake protein YcgR